MTLPGIVRSITLGNVHACAHMLSPNQVRCWGRAQNSELGVEAGYAYGDEATELTPVPVPLGAFAPTQIVAGGTHTCARSVLGVKCWGSNTFGQLGYGDTVERGRNAALMGDNLPVLPLPGVISHIDARSLTTCAVNSAGELRCWGSPIAAGQPALAALVFLGDQPGEVASLPPVDVGPGLSVSKVATGSSTCALMTSGILKCWGLNVSGELGLGDTVRRGNEVSNMGANLPPVGL